MLYRARFAISNIQKLFKNYSCLYTGIIRFLDRIEYGMIGFLIRKVSKFCTPLITFSSIVQQTWCYCIMMYVYQTLQTSLVLPNKPCEIIHFNFFWQFWMLDILFDIGWSFLWNTRILESIRSYCYSHTHINFCYLSRTQLDDNKSKHEKKNGRRHVKAPRLMPHSLVTTLPKMVIFVCGCTSGTTLNFIDV